MSGRSILSDARVFSGSGQRVWHARSSHHGLGFRVSGFKVSGFTVLPEFRLCKF